MFQYSRQNDLDELLGHLAELQKQPKGTRTLKELKSGVFDNTQQISVTEIAIREHENEKSKEREIFDKEVRRQRNLQRKKDALPLAIEYLYHLEKALAAATSASSGDGYLVSDDIQLAMGAKQVEFKKMIEHARRGVKHLEQFKD